MPMLMIKFKTCGEVFPGLNANNPHTCSRGHHNKYVLEDYMDWS